jgi:hypothetical protein
MTQEDKDLLLKDICSRLPYGVKVLYEGQVKEIQYIEPLYNELKLLENASNYTIGIEEIKPYLRPMSSMTEEEKVQLSQYACIGEDLNGEFIDEVQRKDCAAYIDWLNKNHFDYRGLILKGLAMEATEGMY